MDHEGVRAPQHLGSISDGARLPTTGTIEKRKGDSMHTNLTRADFFKGAAAGALGVGTLTALSSPAIASESSSPMTPEQAGQPWDFEIPPAAITDISETFDADVVVVGAGTAGLVSAVSAIEEGLSVIVVTASSKPISRGGSNNAAYSKVMEAQGLPRYSPEQIRKEIAMNYNSVDQKKWYKHYNHSEEAMNWLIDIMAEAGYDCAIEQGPMVSEGDLYYTAPAAHGFIDAENQSVGMTQPFVVNTLADKFTSLGGTIYYQHIGRQLVRGDIPNGTQGRVTGVIVERDDGTYAQFNGSKAVILATGDFSADRAMMTKYCPWVAPYIADEVYDAPMDYDKEFVMGGLYRGDMHKAGLWIGAAWQKTFPNAPMGGTISAGPSPIVYDPHWGLLLDRNGERFMNEYCSSQMSGRTQWLQAGEKSFAIWNRNFARASSEWFPGQGGIGIMEPLTEEELIANWDASADAGTYLRFDTLEELVDALGLPKEAALASIERYNEMCAAGKDTDFYKDPRALVAIDEPPYYGVASGGVGVLCILGGLRTDGNMRVCDTDDDPIPGLYNVGTMVGDFYAGLYTFQMEGINYGATCITFGYLTGKYVAANE